MKQDHVFGHSDATITASCFKDFSSSLALNVTMFQEPGLLASLCFSFSFNHLKGEFHKNDEPVTVFTSLLPIKLTCCVQITNGLSIYYCKLVQNKSYL